MAKEEVGNKFLTEASSTVLSIKIWTIGSQSENVSNHRWVYYNFPLNNWLMICLLIFNYL